MHLVEPKVFLIAESKINEEELHNYLNYVNAVTWKTDAPTDIEELVEVMGRSCYKSWIPLLNPNVTKIREGNKNHLENLINVGHGSVLEHGWASFMLCDVSRIVTHELVRHRVGTAYSQESLRFLRLDDLGYWIPSCFKNNPKAVSIIKSAFQLAETHYKILLSTETLGEDIDKMPFSKKKELTSAARRVAPIGLATNIGWSCNIRALRHIIEARTDPSAEEEIRLVFSKVAAIARQQWGNLFSDYEVEDFHDIPWYKTVHRKV